MANIPIMKGLTNGLESIYIERGSSHQKGDVQVETIKERQKQIEDENEPWNKFAVFPEGTTTNGTHLIKFKRGAFAGMKTIQPCFIKVSDRMVSPVYDFDFMVFFIIMASSLCMYTCTVHIMPEFTPTNKMLEMHADKGNEDWIIYAECVRRAMAKAANLKLCNQPVRDKLQLEKLYFCKTDEIKVGNRVISYKVKDDKKRDLYEVDLPITSSPISTKGITEPLIGKTQ